MVVTSASVVVAEDESCGILVVTGGGDVHVHDVAEIAEYVVQ